MSEEASQPEAPQVDSEHLLLIVVGAHLRAEVADRPLAYQLRDKMLAWITRHRDSINVPIVPVVCSDVWYVNHEALQTRPTVSLGGPGVNALSAYYAQKVEQAMLSEHKMIIQLDPEYVHLRVAVWGINHELTVQAVQLFTQRYLESYLRAVATQVEPEVG